ncbi:Isochorismatase-like [Phytophthora cactorum]|nr:Isochorismatase-like [Phytophthora cactorum]
MNKIVNMCACLVLLLVPSLAVIPPAVIPSAIEAAYNDFVKHDVADDAEQAESIPLGGLAILVIDQQVSFHPGGSLAIPTANEDAARIAGFITNHTSELSQIVLTMDSHQRYHIAHGIFWKNDAGESPQPLTTITSKDIKNGFKRLRVGVYKALEASGKFSLTIWPEHCLIGSPGHNIVPNVLASALKWTKKSLKPIQYVMKGSNPFTEHYSALKAEYELPYDPSTR